MILILRCDTCNARYSNRPVFAIEKRGCCIFLIAEQVLTLSLFHFISLYTGQKFAGCRCNGGCGVCGHIERRCLQTVQRGKWCCCCRSQEVWWSQVHDDADVFSLFVKISKRSMKMTTMTKKMMAMENNENVSGVSWRATSLPSLSLLSLPQTACLWWAYFQIRQPYPDTFIFYQKILRWLSSTQTQPRRSSRAATTIISSCSSPRRWPSSWSWWW